MSLIDNRAFSFYAYKRIKYKMGNWSMVLNQLMVDDCFKNRINKYIEY